MYHPIRSFTDFKQILSVAQLEIQILLIQYPNQREIISIKNQLEEVRLWLHSGIRPTQDQKDGLNFGLLASRYIHELDSRVASNLYELASYIITW